MDSFNFLVRYFALKRLFSYGSIPFEDVNRDPYVNDFMTERREEIRKKKMHPSEFELTRLSYDFLCMSSFLGHLTDVMTERKK